MRKTDPTGVVRDSAVRRLADLVLGALGLLVASPVIAVLAALIRRGSPGPAIYRQRRVGRDGLPFELWKFRTMVDGAAGPMVSGPNDARVTRIGRWLRRRRLDELPQLVNVVRGDMTLIGPRPEVPRFLPYYSRDELGLLAVRPGVIGPGAVLFAEQQAARLDDGRDPETTYVTEQLHPKLAADLAYLRQRSLSRDVAVLLSSLRAVTREPEPVV